MKSLLIKNLKRRKTPWAIRCSLKREMIAVCNLFNLDVDAATAWQILKDKTCFILFNGELGIVSSRELDNVKVDIIEAEDFTDANYY